MFQPVFRRCAFGLFLGGLGLALLTAARGAEPAAGAPKQTPDQLAVLWRDAKQKLANSPEDEQALKEAASVAGQLERSPATVKLAIQANRELSGILARSDNPKVAARARQFASTARRLAMLGHPLAVEGRLVNGSPLDADQLKGKVVLVDFWATWCGPCRAELPNVKRNYAKYHARGFEVVGVSLDTDIEKLRTFVDDQKLEWPVLFHQKAGSRGWDHPMAVRCSVSSVPTAILLDQAGRVVSINARGPELGRLLEKLLGKRDE